MAQKYINYIQLRAARHVLNLGVRDLAKVLKVSKATISKTELGKTRDFLYKHSAALIDFFFIHNITFPNEYCIRYHPTVSVDVLNIVDDNGLFISRFQLRAARHILNISQEELAERINIKKTIITTAELLQNNEYVLTNNIPAATCLKTFFKLNNIEFSDKSSIVFKKYVDKFQSGW